MPGNKRVADEREIVERFLAPLAARLLGAFNLNDDCAALQIPNGSDVVATVDAIAEGVHFLGDDEPRDIAWKALAVNVSDLAAKGAQPLAYLMSLSFPEAPLRSWLSEFARGLEVAQDAFGMVLAGGDTDRRQGPLTITITALGHTPHRAFVRRNGARPGDRLFLTGTLGDSFLGLSLLREHDVTRKVQLSNGDRDFLLARYRRPEPRIALRAALRRQASAAIDISDGLAKDLGHMCRASGVGARILAAKLPYSAPAQKLMASGQVDHGALIAGGGDYELLIAVPATCAERFVSEAAEVSVPLQEIGQITERDIIFEDESGSAVPVVSTGYDHFAAR